MYSIRVADMWSVPYHILATRYGPVRDLEPILSVSFSFIVYVFMYMYHHDWHLSRIQM